jgi:hypothetical protein
MTPHMVCMGPEFLLIASTSHSPGNVSFTREYGHAVSLVVLYVVLVMSLQRFSKADLTAGATKG